MPAICCDSVVTGQVALTDTVRLLSAAWPDETHLPHGGQFFMLRCWGAEQGPFLSRPISLHRFDAAEKTVKFLYELKGQGTHRLAQLRAGQRLQLTGPLGNGFDAAAVPHSARVALVGGGIGVAPLYQLALELNAQGILPDGCFGFRDEPFVMESFRGPCRVVRVATDSGRFGYHGLVTALLKPQEYDIVFACGPVPMLRGVYELCRQAGVRCLVSMEKKMACGIGACLGCTCHTGQGGRSVCKDGPVFEGSEVFGL